jgi:hypothetical protein
MAKMFTPPKAPAAVTTTAPVVTPVTATPATTTVTAPAPVAPVVETKPVVTDPVPITPDPAPVPPPVSPPKVVDTATTPAPAPTPTTSVVKPETDPIVAAEQALAKRDRSVSGTVLTSWRGVLQPTATGSSAPARKRLLGE